jgi:hypothetical protein
MARPETQTDRVLRVTSQLTMEGMLLGLGWGWSRRASRYHGG